MRESFPQPQESPEEKAEAVIALEAKLRLLAEQAGKPGASWAELRDIWRDANADAKADIAFSPEDVRFIEFMAEDQQEAA